MISSTPSLLRHPAQKEAATLPTSSLLPAFSQPNLLDIQSQLGQLPSQPQLLSLPPSSSTSYSLQPGDLKKAFLGKLGRQVFEVQLVTCPELRAGVVRKVLALSDSRDSTTSWAVRDSLLVALVKRGLQPVIRVTKHLVDVHNDKPTLNIVSYEVIDEATDVLGKPAPIQMAFFNYLRNLARTPPAVQEVQAQVQAKGGRCRKCRGCLSTNSCRKAAKVKCSSCSRGERALCSRKACERLDQELEGRKEAREEARQEASYTAASREGRCGQCQGCQPCRFPVLCEFCKKGLRFQCTKKKFGDCVFLRHSPPKRARLAEVSEGAQLAEVSEKARLSEVSEKARLAEVSEKARLADFWSTPQGEPTLQENLAPTSQQNLGTEFGIRGSGYQEAGIRRSGSQEIRSPGGKEIGPARRSETTADDSADYNIKMEPEELEEVKEVAKEDDWTLSLQMEIKKEAVEDVTFVAC